MNKPFDVMMVQALIAGEPIIEKRGFKPKFKEGDIIGVKETWAQDVLGNVYYKADGHHKIKTWLYANTMPKEHIRYRVKVSAIEKMTQQRFLKKFGRCIKYSGGLFYYSSCDTPGDTEWFRERQWEYEIPLNSEVYAITYELTK